jgi:hypothetical protein
MVVNVKIDYPCIFYVFKIHQTTLNLIFLVNVVHLQVFQIVAN